MAANVTKTAIRLADGRELLYFDDKPGIDRSQPDRRNLAATRTASEIRYDVLVDQWVVIAGHRQTRTHLPPTTECPLCPSTPGRPTEIPADDYDVVVFENRFPSLSYGIESGVVDPPAGQTGDGVFLRRPGIGRCEVVCFTADHDTSFAQLPPERVATVLEAWTDRTRELSVLPGVEQVFVFENRGEEIGVTLSHPHGQIYAYPFVAPRAMRMVGTAERHRATRGTCLFCVAIVAEEAAAVRVVARTSHWVAFVPHAARWPFEVHIYPRRHVPDLTALDETEREQFPELYLDVLHRFDGIFGTKMPYIAGWQQAPVRVGHDLGHLFLQVFSIRRAPGKLKYLAASESAMGVFINDIAPEQAAKLLRDAG
ncbi:MAG TPA: galactose-1-phosphate uridylyltransferase [Actinomycetes bacterium]|jgi:UDPglucose--hexose-1-phosphate uridylyltransferase|nr:galactose-1-phosphate uridylyltransferase [Actinomycetes bacterium]